MASGFCAAVVTRRTSFIGFRSRWSFDLDLDSKLRKVDDEFQIKGRTQLKGFVLIV